MSNNNLYLYPMKMIPVFKDYIWGGTNLKKLNKSSTLSKIAESWEVSCNEDGLSKIENGPYAGKYLKDVINLNFNKFIGNNIKQGSKFPLIIKLIDANRDLSIQVHPSFKTVDKELGESEKSEMWYILDCEENSYIFYGFNKNLTEEEFSKYLLDDNICSVLNKVHVKKGDIFFVPAGTIHALGKGIVAAEIQQNSNTTFRIFDYNRKDANGNYRTLHIEKAKKALSFKQTYINRFNECSNDSFQCKYFKVKKEKILDHMGFSSKEDSFCIIQFIKGSGNIEYKNVIHKANKGDTFFIPANMGKYIINGNCEILTTKI